MIYLLMTALLIVIGVGILGGALFGRIRERRLGLLGTTIVLWFAAAFIFTACAPPLDVSQPESPIPTPMPVEPTAVTATEAVEVEPTPAPTATVEPATPEPPTPSPEASLGKLVFPSARAGNLDIWVMDLRDPDHPTQLTTAPEADVEPVWSPDGSQIIFSSGQGTTDGVNELWLMNADGSEPRKLLEWPESFEWGATWSPDGDKLAFATTRDYNYEIYVMDIEGEGEPINITRHSRLDTFPDWSPDGKWLAFMSDRSGNWEIWKLNIAECLPARLAGEGEEEACEASQLTDHPDDDMFPRWSSDSSRIAFSSRRFANRDIYVMDADGGNVTRITTNPQHDSNPIWALDDSAIIYSSKQGGQWDIYIIDSDGSNNRQLTNSPAEDRFGDWHP